MQRNEWDVTQAFQLTCRLATKELGRYFYVQAQLARRAQYAKGYFLILR
jgi:hypothetical protein